MRKMHLRVVVGSLIVFGLAVAKAQPVPEPDSARATIAVSIEGKPPAGFGKMTGVQVSFVRVQDDEDILNAEYVITSNYSRNGQVYLLNARPGRYVAVATQFARRVGFDYHAFFSMDMIPQTEITVSAGEMVFMGSFSVNTSTKMSEADAAQSHYFRLVLPTEATQGFAGRTFLGGISAYTATLSEVSKDAAGEEDFWSDAQRRVFRRQPIWQARAQQKLDELSRISD